MLTMTRQHLYSALIRAAQREGVEIMTNSEVIAATAAGKLMTIDGRNFKADLVVGVDGREWEDCERPLTEHTQDCSAQIANERRLSRWDVDTLRTANHVPTGTGGFGPLVERKADGIDA